MNTSAGYLPIHPTARPAFSALIPLLFLGYLLCYGARYIFALRALRIALAAEQAIEAALAS